MARASLPDFNGPHPQYNSIITKTDGTVLGQVKSMKPTDSIDSVKAGRVGSSRKKTLKKGKDAKFQAELWIDEDLQELAVFLNASATPTTGQTLKLDPDADPTTMLIKNYDGEAADATLKSTIYLYNAVATELGLSYDEEGEQVASISGDLEDLYWVVA